MQKALCKSFIHKSLSVLSVAKEECYNRPKQTLQSDFTALSPSVPTVHSHREHLIPTQKDSGLFPSSLSCYST